MFPIYFTIPPPPIYLITLLAQLVKNLPAMQETCVWFLGWEDTLEKEMATHSSILAWRIPWTEKPGRRLNYYYYYNNIIAQKSKKCWKFQLTMIRILNFICYYKIFHEFALASP